MLVDSHLFDYYASVPWPHDNNYQMDWVYGIRKIEQWLNQQIGHHLIQWAWNDSQLTYNIGVAFRQDKDRLLFVITWS